MKQELLQHKIEIIAFFRAITELNEDYVLADWFVQRFRKNYKLPHYIKEVLKENPDGLHFREITKVILDKYQINTTERKVHSFLAKGGDSTEYINIWLGIYTLKSNQKYSWEKTPDLIYSYLKEFWNPKTVDEIQKYVLERKKVEAKTVRVALEYPKEFRFCFYKDGKVWLKEWWLWNVREKKPAKKYDISLSKAMQQLLNSGLLKKWEFYDITTLKTLLSELHSDKTITLNTQSMYNILDKMVQGWSINKTNKSDKNIYFLT